MLYDAEYHTQRQRRPFVRYNSKWRQTPLVRWWIWLREGNIAIFYDVQYDSKRQTLPSCVKLRLIQSLKLSYCIMALVMTQRGKLCHLVWCWMWHREVKYYCVVWWWIQLRGKLQWKHVKRWWEAWMPRCRKYEWRHNRHKRGGRKNVGGLLYGFRFLSGGLMFGRWAFALIPGQMYPKETTDSFSVSTRTRRLIVWLL